MLELAMTVLAICATVAALAFARLLANWFRDR
jgi:hypothetical protein